MGRDRVGGYWRTHRLSTDAGMAAFLGVLATFSVANQFRVNDAVGVAVHQSQPTSYALVWLCVAPLALRRLAPMWSYGACVAAFIATRAWEVPESTVTVVALAASFISVGVHGARRGRTALRSAGAAALVVMYVLVAVRTSRRADLGDAFDGLLVFDVVFSTLVIAGAWVLGDTWRQRAEHGRVLAARTIELDEERRLNADRAVVEERLRIARELHDVLAHHVSVMGVHASAAGRVLGHDPGRARESLGVIERSSREAIDEFRRLVGFLRAGNAAADGESQPGEPQPGLGRCGELVADARRGGLDVELRVSGCPASLPPGVDLSAFRVVQEALTNIRKHAGATRADVAIEYRPDRLAITVDDNGRGPSPTLGQGGPAGRERSAGPAARSPGLGLMGMQERLRLHEGRLETGPGPTGGFRVHAVFPLRAAP